MSRLMSAHLRRLFRDKVFWGCGLVMAVWAVLVCLFSYNAMVSSQHEIVLDAIFFYAYGLDGVVPVFGLIFAIFCSLFIGTEYSDGTIRNKLIVGRTRLEIGLAGYLTCALAGLIMNLCYFIVMLIAGIPLFGFFQLPGSAVLLLLAAGSLMTLSAAAFFHFIALLSANRTATAIVNIMTVILVMFLAIVLRSRIAEPPMTEVFEMKDGEVTTLTVPNRQYLNESQRFLAQLTIDVLPTAQALQISGMTCPHPERLPLYSGMMIILINGTGLILFSRKDIK